MAGPSSGAVAGPYSRGERIDLTPEEREAKRLRSEKVSVWYRKTRSGTYVCMKQRHNFLSFGIGQTCDVIKSLAGYYISTRQDVMKMDRTLKEIRVSLKKQITKMNTENELLARSSFGSIEAVFKELDELKKKTDCVCSSHAQIVNPNDYDTDDEDFAKGQLFM